MRSQRFHLVALLILAMPLAAMPAGFYVMTAAEVDGYEVVAGRVVGHQCHAERTNRTLCRSVIEYQAADGRAYTFVEGVASSGREALGAPVRVLASTTVPGAAVRGGLLGVWGGTTISALICGGIFAFLLLGTLSARRRALAPRGRRQGVTTGDGMP